MSEFMASGLMDLQLWLQNVHKYVGHIGKRSSNLFTSNH